MAARSAVSSSGLVGDSTHSRSASSARATHAAVSAGAKRSTRQPWSRAPASAMPATRLVAVVGDHEVRARRQLAAGSRRAAAMPEAKATARPPSRPPITVSKASQVSVPSLRL